MSQENVEIVRRWIEACQRAATCDAISTRFSIRTSNGVPGSWPRSRAVSFEATRAYGRWMSELQSDWEVFEVTPQRNIAISATG